jgi:hypothetical protein
MTHGAFCLVYASRFGPAVARGSERAGLEAAGVALGLVLLAQALPALLSTLGAEAPRGLRPALASLGCSAAASAIASPRLGVPGLEMGVAAVSAAAVAVAVASRGRELALAARGAWMSLVPASALVVIGSVLLHRTAGSSRLAAELAVAGTSPLVAGIAAAAVGAALVANLLLGDPPSSQGARELVTALAGWSLVAAIILPVALLGADEKALLVLSGAYPPGRRTIRAPFLAYPPAVA